MLTKSRMRKRFKLLARDCELLAQRVEAGTITESDKRRKASDLARSYLKLSQEARKFFGPYVGAYVAQSCYRIGLELKYIAAEPANEPHKGLDIRHKVVNPTNAWRY